MDLKEIKQGSIIRIKELECYGDYKKKQLAGKIMIVREVIEYGKYDNIHLKLNDGLTYWFPEEWLELVEPTLVYSDNTLKGKIGDVDVNVSSQSDDLEKVCMLALLQSKGYSYEDVKELCKTIKWTPKYGEEYYYLTVKSEDNLDSFTDTIRFDKGNCFRTYKEAEDKLEEVLKLKEEMKNEK